MVTLGLSGQQLIPVRKLIVVIGGKETVDCGLFQNVEQFRTGPIGLV